MKKIYLKEQLEELRNYSIEVINSISETIDILDDNYGVDRDVDNNLGGYVVIAENIVDTEILKQDKLQGLIPEYVDMIECSREINYNSILYILSSDFAIVVVTTEELSKFLLE